MKQRDLPSTDTLAGRMRFAMELRGWTTAELARACGVSQVAVHKWLNGQTRVLRAEVCEAAAMALNVTSSWLNFGEGHGPSEHINVATKKVLRRYLKQVRELLDAIEAALK